MNVFTTMGLWLYARARSDDERGAALVLEALAIGVVGVLLLLAFLPAARTLVTDIVDWVRTNTIG
ncbi:MAG: hypothetical protein ACRD0H_24815 [Actinomycetes bacterium]